MRLSLCVLVLSSLVSAVSAEQQKITVLVTTDLHGNIYPWDYFTAKAADRGLAKISTIVKRIRTENPNTILIDCGDTIQGTPLEYVYQTYVKTGQLPAGLSGSVPSVDPMMLVMNRMGYGAMVLGNHEFNFGQKNLDRARRDARFPWLSANTLNERKNYLRYTILRAGQRIRVAIVGATTPSIPLWEKEENYEGYRFLSIPEAMRETMAEVDHQEKDVVIVAAHSGLGRDLKTGSIDSGADGENTVYEMAERVPGIDAIVFGHSHRELAGASIKDVLLLQPRNWGMSLGRLDLVLEKNPGHGWKVLSKTSSVIPVTADIPADPEILELAKPYHEAAERYLDTVVAESSSALDASHGRVEDTALVDAIHQVQMHYAKADVSFTALFNPRVKVAKGPVTVRQIAALYLYENELYAIEGTGKMVKDALENAARYFTTCPDQTCSGSLVNSRVPGYNYDMAQGVEYDVDLRQPEGNRIRNLRFHGKALEPDRKLTIAVNNYRFGGSGGYTMFRDARVIWRSNEDLRQLIIDYFTEHKRLPALPDRNWKIVPEAAVRNLRAHAGAESATR
jgi:2',3'-cyclic-nucleotide 2'-phosphodiesterase/3'-nucleotidase